MKHIFLLASALIFLTASFAQKPEPIYGFARVQKPLPYYQEQAILWKKEVDKDPKDPNAWYNYYRVKKNLVGIDSTNKLSRPGRVEELKEIVEQMAVQIPNTYEYNYCKFSFEGNNFEYLSYLKKADELCNGKTLHLEYMVNWGEVERDIEMRNRYCRKIYDAGEFSPGLMYYNYNVIAGTRPNAIIFTAGDNDTYPIWLLQSHGIREDITVLNLHLLHIDEYRARVFKELGIEKFDIPKSSKNHDSNKMIQKRFKNEIIKHVATNKKRYPVYVALTVSEHKDYLKEIEENLYLTGLTYQYSLESLDNMAIMKRNFEHQYALDYIEKSFYNDISHERVRLINCNYVVPMLKLYNHYKESADLQKMESIKQRLLFIAKDSPEEKDIKKHLDLK